MTHDDIAVIAVISMSYLPLGCRPTSRAYSIGHIFLVTTLLLLRLYLSVATLHDCPQSTYIIVTYISRYHQ